MKTFLQVIFVIWFVVLNLFLLLPSYKLLKKMCNQQTTAPVPPEPPTPPKLEALNQTQSLEQQEKVIKANQIQLTAYSEEVKVYSERASSYKKYIELFDPDNIYQLVVKETITPLLNTFVAAVLAYVFAKVVSEAMANYVRSKGREPIESTI